MRLWNPVAAILKQFRAKPAPPAPPKVAALFAPPYGPPGGWWRDDPAEQLRNYQSWVYAAVNAIAQEVARQRPYLYVNTGQAEHEQTPLPHTHPLCRLLDNPNPWLTPWELWYLTVVYLELTGMCFRWGTQPPAAVGDIRAGPRTRLILADRAFIAGVGISHGDRWDNTCQVDWVEPERRECELLYFRCWASGRAVRIPDLSAKHPVTPSGDLARDRARPERRSDLRHAPSAEFRPCGKKIPLIAGGEHLQRSAALRYPSQYPSRLARPSSGGCRGAPDRG